MYILDIETTYTPDLLEVYTNNIKPSRTLKDKTKIEADLEKKKEEAKMKMCLDHDYASIRCIGVKPVGEKAMIFKTLQEFSDWLNIERRDDSVGYVAHNYDQTPITFNGAEFDIPILMKAAIREGIEDFPFKKFLPRVGKYAKGHVDLMQKLGMVWGANKSLDAYLQIYLGIAKKPIDFETATEQEIIDHCIEDVENTEKLYLLTKDKLFV